MFTGSKGSFVHLYVILLYSDLKKIKVNSLPTFLVLFPVLETVTDTTHMGNRAHILFNWL